MSKISGFEKQKTIRGMNLHASYEAYCRTYWCAFSQLKFLLGDHLVSVVSEIEGNVRFRYSGDGSAVISVIADNGEIREYPVPPRIDVRVGEGARVGVGDVLIRDFPMRRETTYHGQHDQYHRRFGSVENS